MDVRAPRRATKVRLRAAIVANSGQMAAAAVCGGVALGALPSSCFRPSMRTSSNPSCSSGHSATAGSSRLTLPALRAVEGSCVAEQEDFVRQSTKREDVSSKLLAKIQEGTDSDHIPEKVRVFVSRVSAVPRQDAKRAE